MRSSILIVSYLWKDTWSRWLEQPSSLLARLFVGMLLVAVATVILVAFRLLERSLRDRLERFGLNTLVVREMIPASDPELLAQSERPDRLAPLANAGVKVRLRQLFPRALTEWQQSLPVMSYPSDALPFLSDLLDPETPLICLSDALPEGVRIRVTLQRQTGVAVVRPMPDYLRPLISESVLLVPQGWSLEAERMGFTETTLFRKESARFGMQEYVNALNLLYAADRRAPPQIQSALPLLRELEDLQTRQNQWRGLLAGILGMMMALVFGAIAVLEFRQTLFVSALLRSLGTPGRFLYLRQWLENAFLANVAAIAAIAVVSAMHETIFGGLGFPRKVLNLGEINPYWSSEIGLVLLWVNVGAFLSSLPVAVGLRQPVGAVLN